MDKQDDARTLKAHTVRLADRSELLKQLFYSTGNQSQQYWPQDWHVVVLLLCPASSPLDARFPFVEVQITAAFIVPVSADQKKILQE